MRRLSALAAVFFMLSAGRLCAESRDVLAIYSELITRAMRQGPTVEEAAFLVRENDGAMKCYLWPRATDRLRQSWLGAIPEGTVAIAHTHPEGYGAWPSRGDRRTARLTGLPIVVVTLWEVTAFDPRTNQVRKVSPSRRWRAAADRRGFSCSEKWARR